MVEQSTAASHSLAQDTAELERPTARFNTGAETSSDPVRMREGEESKASRASAPVRALRVEGNTVRKPLADEANWSEF